ncbi:MAG: hypothetical protein HYW34_01150, partial [Candidatus Brennerbacteria bacterium]|nr:hypothetical protein [Candidatus Brennerbacteria bacterium]
MRWNVFIFGFLAFVLIFAAVSVLRPDGLFEVLKVLAATNVDSVFRYAWGDGPGWFDFFSADSVIVASSSLQGWADSSIGPLALNCDSTPNGNICSASSTWSVANDGSGNLSGWAWNDTIGWVSFWCGNVTSTDCTTSNYRVRIMANRDFQNYAWNDTVGWISFNCVDPNVCGTSNYKLKSAWGYASATGTLVSSIFDSGISDGVSPNSIMWLGDQPAGSVTFQIASATSTAGPWNYIGP